MTKHVDENPNAFKHALGPGAVSALAGHLSRAYPKFDAPGFLRVADDLGPLAMKARAVRITEALDDALGLPFPRGVKVVVKACPPPGEKLGMFLAWPLVHYVGRFGTDHPKEAVAALRAMTATFSGEFDIRPFLLRHPDFTLAELMRWTADPNEHVRRLVSEGTRPRLPWGERLQAFIADPAPTLALLERLRADPSEYVRRSVANHLGDIGKDHPELAAATVGRWLAEAPSPEMRALAKHALRTLVKRGNSAALKTLGHGDANGLAVSRLDVPATVRIGEHLAISCRVENRSRRTRTVVVDFAVHYLGARGERKAPKVFKLRTVELAPAAAIDLTKRHAMRDVSVRRHVPGTHRVDIQVNGEILAGRDFDLLRSAPRNAPL